MIDLHALGVSQASVINGLINFTMLSLVQSFNTLIASLNVYKMTQFYNTLFYNINLDIVGWALFGCFFFHHSISITSHSSLKIYYPFGTITYLSTLNIFHTVCEPIPVTQCNFFFFFF